ncbi:MAG: ATP-binding protein [Cyanobacteria bacterium J06643_5]
MLLIVSKFINLNIILSGINETTTITNISAENTTLIRIADNGIGILNTIQNKMFDPFFTNEPVGEGKGLGLSISYQIIVKKHEDNIKYRTKYEKSTEFLIEIPIKSNSQ